MCLAVALLGSISCSTAGQSVKPAEQAATIQLNVNLIQVNASVVDAAGKVVSGLEKSDFHLLVDGRPRPIDVFESEDAPVAAGILVDNSASMSRKSPEVIAAALAFARVSNPRDQMFVVHFSGQVRLAVPAGKSFTSDIPELEAALSQFSAEGTTALYDAVVLAVSQCQKARLERKVLLIISDGGDNSSQASFEKAVTSAQRTGIVIYCVGIYDSADRDRNPQVLSKFAEMTGGQAFFPEELKEVTNTCVKIARDIRQQYTLGFAGGEDGKYHRIQITVSHPHLHDLMVRTRDRYFAPKP